MMVVGLTGERLGKVIHLGPDTFTVEKGMLFPKDFQLRYDHIADVENGAIVYSLTDAERPNLERPLGSAETVAASLFGGKPPAGRPGKAGNIAGNVGRKLGEGSEVRIPLMKEELDLEKYSREAGHVRLHKEVRVEERHFTVPLWREDVVVEHVMPPDRGGALPDRASASFQEQTLDLALHEQDFRVDKHAVLREEVIVRMVAEAFEREGTTSVRTEELAVEDTRAPRRTFNRPGAPTERRPNGRA